MACSLEEIFEPGGILQKSLPHYEFRPSQLEMAQAVLASIQEGRHLLVEAGTGTGKTLSYLIPSLLSGKRIMVSTATKNLQSQLFSKDIPFIRKHLFPDVKAACMKGRQNYICLKRLQDQRRQGGLFREGEEQVFAALTTWAQTSGTGDRTELDWLCDDDRLWNTVDSRSDRCVGQKCEFFKDCFVTRMRQEAFESDLVVVNHALLFANLAIETDEIGKILPDFPVLILDEAHQLEDIAAEYFGSRLSNYQLEDLCRELRKTFSENLRIQKTGGRIEENASRFFASFPRGDGRYSLTSFKAYRGSYDDLRADLIDGFETLIFWLRTAFHQIEAQRERPDNAEAIVRRISRYMEILESIFLSNDPSRVYWYEKSGRGVFLHLTPIDLAPLLAEKLFQRADATILTSATMVTDGSFAFIRSRLGVPNPVELSVPGEFDYALQTALYIPRTAPAPGFGDHFQFQVSQIRRLLEICNGNAFLLFTSVSQMKKVYEVLSLEPRFPVSCQGEMPREQLLERFKETPGAVLCATSSFWQGVDVQGDTLRAVVIDKLPFQVPTEPLVAARCERLRGEGRDAFLSYSVPSAIITLRQGLGRLIRSRSDSGILAILDSRLWTKSYGKLFLESLPNCPVTDNMEELKNFFERNVSQEVGSP